jgi:hypothetical protein
MRGAHAALEIMKKGCRRFREGGTEGVLDAPLCCVGKRDTWRKFPGVSRVAALIDKAAACSS